MAYFTDFDTDIKPLVSGAFSNFNIESLQSYIDSSVDSYMIPLFGVDFCEQIEDGTISDVKARKPFLMALANWAFFKYASDGALNISDAGLTQYDDGQSKGAYQWQVRNFKRERENVACPAMFKLFNYLEANLASFTQYRDCEERYLFVGVPIRGYAYFNNWQKVKGFCTYVAMRSELGKAMMDLGCIITESLTNDVVSAVKARNYDADMLALLPYVEQYMAAKALKYALISLPIVITPAGVYVSERHSMNRNDTEERSDGHAIGKLTRQMDNDLRQASHLLSSFLDKNASASKYSSYYNEVVLPNADKNTDQTGLNTFRL